MFIISMRPQHDSEREKKESELFMFILDISVIADYCG